MIIGGISRTVYVHDATKKRSTMGILCAGGVLQIGVIMKKLGITIKAEVKNGENKSSNRREHEKRREKRPDYVYNVGNLHLLTA